MKIKKINKKGFTLIEVMIVIAILGVIAAFSAPALMDAYKNFNLKGESRDLYSNLQKAKLVAIKENANVLIQFFPQAYTPDGGVGRYYIFVDNGAGGGNAGNNSRDGSEEILANRTMPKGISLFNISGTFTGTPSTYYNGRGLPMIKGNVEMRNTDTWYKISISTANIKMEMSKDGTWP